MHSNIGDVDELVATTQLPEEVRPWALGFGTLTDGFLGFETGEGERTVKLASVVMKVSGKRWWELHGGCGCGSSKLLEYTAVR